MVFEARLVIIWQLIAPIVEVLVSNKSSLFSSNFGSLELRMSHNCWLNRKGNTLISQSGKLCRKYKTLSRNSGKWINIMNTRYLFQHVPLIQKLVAIGYHIFQQRICITCDFQHKRIPNSSINNSSNLPIQLIIKLLDLQPIFESILRAFTKHLLELLSSFI